MRSLRVDSELVPPGKTAVVLKPIPPRHLPTAVMQTAETAAAFTIERVDLLRPREVMALGGPPQAGLWIRVRNDSSGAASFVAAIDLSPDTELLVTEFGEVVERDWKMAYDRAMAALRAGSPTPN